MSKRGNNEGNIRHRPDGRWEARITLPSGQRKSVYGETRAEVNRKLSRLLAQIEKGVSAPNERLTVAAFFEEWLRDYVKPSVRPKTYISYESDVRLHIIPRFGKIALTKLQPQHIQRMMAEMLEAGLSPRTVADTRATVRRALNIAMRWGMVQRNVATLVDPPKRSDKEPVTLSPEQARTFLAGIQEDRLRALYWVAIAIGLRQGEILGLRWEDVDLDAGTLSVRNALQRIDGEWKLVPPKTERSRRKLRLPTVALDQLRQHCTRQSEERALLGAEWDDWGLVFVRPHGKPIFGEVLTKDFQKLLARLGLPKIRFQDLRHSCATFLISQGLSPRVVMETLGHSNIHTTLQIYSHVLEDDRQAAADTMDGVLGSGLGSKLGSNGKS